MNGRTCPPTTSGGPNCDRGRAIARALAIGPESSAAERTIDITTLGARSGLPRRIEIWFHHIDGRWYLTGMPVPRGWYANLRAESAVRRASQARGHRRLARDRGAGRRADTAESDHRGRSTCRIDPSSRRGSTGARIPAIGSRAARWSRSCSTTNGCGQRPRPGPRRAKSGSETSRAAFPSRRQPAGQQNHRVLD